MKCVSPSLNFCPSTRQDRCVIVKFGWHDWRAIKGLAKAYNVQYNVLYSLSRLLLTSNLKRQSSKLASNSKLTCPSFAQPITRTNNKLSDQYLQASLVEFLQSDPLSKVFKYISSSFLLIVLQQRLEFLADCTTWIRDCINLYLWILVAVVELVLILQYDILYRLSVKRITNLGNSKREIELWRGFLYYTGLYLGIPPIITHHVGEIHEDGYIYRQYSILFISWLHVHHNSYIMIY